ncbi:MAG: carboxypeptidase-like regulatory domain-containing protein [Planctomycetaceae bacterium]
MTEHISRHRSPNLPWVVLPTLFTIALLCIPAGCQSASDQPELGLVSGTITAGGQPLPGVAVTFVPEDGRPAMGKTDESGRYQLTYIRDTLGCKIGPNRVEIGASEGSEEAEDDSELEGDELVQSPTRSKTFVIPARYNIQSELTVTVQPGENTFDFDLKP